MNKESHTILTCSHNFATILYSEYHNRDVNQTYRIWFLYLILRNNLVPIKSKSNIERSSKSLIPAANHGVLVLSIGAHQFLYKSKLWIHIIFNVCFPKKEKALLNTIFERTIEKIEQTMVPATASKIDTKNKGYLRVAISKYSPCLIQKIQNSTAIIKIIPSEKLFRQCKILFNK